MAAHGPPEGQGDGLRAREAANEAGRFSAPVTASAQVESLRSGFRIVMPASALAPLLPGCPPSKCYHKGVTTRMSLLKHRWNCSAQNVSCLRVANKGNSKPLSMVFNAFHSLSPVCFSRVISSLSYEAAAALRSRHPKEHQSPPSSAPLALLCLCTLC